MSNGEDVCPSPRVPTSYLDEAVLDGIQKRLERVLVPDELRRLVRALLQPGDRPDAAAAELAAKLGEIRRKIGRLVDALAAGPDDELPSVRSALAELERERQRVEAEVRASKARAVGEDELEGRVQSLIDGLAGVRDILRAGESEERKAVVRGFLKGITIDVDNRRAILQWYRLPQNSFVTVIWWS